MVIKSKTSLADYSNYLSIIIFFGFTIYLLLSTFSIINILLTLIIILIVLHSVFNKKVIGIIDAGIIIRSYFKKELISFSEVNKVVYISTLYDRKGAIGFYTNKRKRGYAFSYGRLRNLPEVLNFLYNKDIKYNFLFKDLKFKEIIRKDGSYFYQKESLADRVSLGFNSPWKGVLFMTLFISLIVFIILFKTGLIFSTQ